jgi:diamine N-acetyltransferase
MVTIKKSTSKDVPVIISVALQSYLNNYTHLWLDRGVAYMQYCFNNDKIATELAETNAAFFIIYNEKEAVGFIKLNVDKAIGSYNAATSLELERLYLLKKASGKGFGQQAMEFVTGFAKKRKKKIIWLRTMEKSAALEFYKKQAFTLYEEASLTYPEIKEEFKKILTLYKEIA